MAIFLPNLNITVGDKNPQQDQSGQSRNIQGELYPVDDRASGVVFQLNPQSISRRRMPLYAEVGAAAADYWSSYNGPSPLQWVRNPPEQISFELVFYANANEHVETPLKKLDRMMSPVSNAPKGSVAGPPDLIFRYGSRSDRVRIMSKEVIEERHNTDLRVQQAHVKLDLKTVKMGGR